MKFRRRADDVVTVTAIDGVDEIVLVTVEAADPAKNDAFFLERSELERAQKAEEPVVELMKSRRRFRLLKPDAEDIFNEIALERLLIEGEDLKHKMLDDPEEALAEGRFDPSRLLYIDWYDHNAYRPGQAEPSNRVWYCDDIVGIEGDEFYLDRAEKILAAHPWILRYERSPYRHWKDEGLRFDVKLPDEVWERLVANLKAKGKGTVHAGPVREALLWATRSDSTDENDYPLGLDPLGLRAARREMPLSRDEDDADDW